MALIIPLSFKNDEKWLYDSIKEHCSYSGWLKEAAKEKLQKESKAISDVPEFNFPKFNEDIM